MRPIHPDMSDSLSVLIAAEHDQAAALLDTLRAGGFELRHALAGSLAQLVQEMSNGRWDVILLAQDSWAGIDQEQVLAIAELLRTPVLVIASSADPEATRAHLRAGAADVIWPAQLDRLPLAVERVRLQAARAAGATGEPTPDEQPEIFIPNQVIQVLLDPTTGRIVDANPAAADLYGFTRAELRGMPLRRLSGDGGEPAQADLLNDDRH